MTDKYRAKKPKQTPYQYKPRKSTCCYSRVGTVKLAYNSPEEAVNGNPDREAYRCLVNNAKWHARKRR